MFSRLRFFLTLLLILSGPSSAAEDQGNLAVARTAFDQGHPRDALAPAQAAVRAAPHDPVRHILLARIALALGDGVLAEAEIDKAQAAGATDTGTTPYLAEAHLLEGDSASAIDESDPARAAPSLTAYAARIHARALFVSGDTSGAKDAFVAALRLAPGDPQLWADIGRFQLETGNSVGAVAAVTRAVALGPRLVDALLLKAALVRLQYGLTASLPWDDRAVAADSGNTAALLDRAATEGDIGRTLAMLADTRAVLRLEPHNPRAFYLNATMAARAGQFALAGRLLDRAGTVLDDMAGMQLLRGIVDYATGRTEEAIDQLGHLVAMQPGNRKARRLLAAAQWQAGDSGAVIRTLVPLVAPDIADPYARALTGRALERQNQRALAAPNLDIAVAPATPAVEPAPDRSVLAIRQEDAAERPNDAGVVVEQVRALLAAGRDAEALATATALRERLPADPQAQIVVGDALLALGHPLEAAQAFRAAANMSFTEPVALRLVDALSRAGDTAGAFAVLNLFIGQNPQDVPARVAAADMLIALDRSAEAAALLAGVRMQTGSRDPALLNNLAWSLYRTGRRREAIALGEAAQALAPANGAVTQTLGWMLVDSGAGLSRGTALLAEGMAELPPGARPVRLVDAAKRKARG